MSSATLRAVIAAVLLFHGVGHLMGVIPALRLFEISDSSASWLKGWTSHSWLLSDLLGEAVARLVSIVLFLTALIGMVGAALGLLGWIVPSEYWRALAIVSAVISLITIALYWNAFIFLFPHKVGAIGVNLAVLVCLIWMDWPSKADIGI